jgi:hypothetical protein
VGTTKLTRKEILSDDPIQEAMIHLVEFFRKNGKWIGIIAAGLLVLGFGAYVGLVYLDSNELQAQKQLAKGMLRSRPMQRMIRTVRDPRLHSAAKRPSTKLQPRSFPL